MMVKSTHSINIMPSPKTRALSRKNQQGQTLVEFLFLMIILIGLSFVMLNGFNTGISNRWQTLVRLIAQPTPSEIEF